MSMLSKPDAGWSVFSIGTRSYSLSYLADIPETWVKHAICGLETHAPFVVYGECESIAAIYCVVDSCMCTIYRMDNNDEAPYSAYGFGTLDFCKALYECISKDIDDWACWNGPGEATGPLVPGEAQEKARLQELLARLRSLIETFEE